MSMPFAVDGWDPSYGSSLSGDLDLEESDGEVGLDVETPAGSWRAVPRSGEAILPAVMFVDGVRRVEARIWIDDHTDEPPARDASVGICASYAAGAVCCSERGAHVVAATVRRGLFA